MLLSMTGYGEAQRQENGIAASVEVRSINSRYFKLTIRAGDAFGSFEPRIESIIRHKVRRGSVQVTVRIERESSFDDYRINENVVRNYQNQLLSFRESLDFVGETGLDSILALPGVVEDRAAQRPLNEDEWPLLETTLTEALSKLTEMRQAEGNAMADDLMVNCQQIDRELDEISARAPLVVESYRDRLTERLKKLLAEFDVTVTAADVVREVGLFAERSDISEEIVRLKSHLSQFDSTMKSTDSPGRRLEFLVQEMFREVNTIGAKANDAKIATHVIEIKAAIERMREMIQNVE